MLDLEARILIDRLKAGGVPEWNAYRQSELADQDLNITFSNFRSAEIPEDLTGIDLSRSVIESGCCFATNRAILVNANLRWSAFPGSFGIGTIDFSGADLRDTDFAGNQIHKFRFANADLRNANFAFAMLARAVPKRDPITNSMVYELRSADFTGAQIDGLNVCGCNIERKLGTLPQSVGSLEEFFAYAQEAGIKTDGATGNVLISAEWEGRFTSYRLR